MPRPLREIDPSICYHVMNRGNNRQRIFSNGGDYEAFLSVLEAGVSRFNLELFCWCIMPNHWHLVLRPGPDGRLGDFMRWLTLTHVRRHHEHRRGQSGHLYQGRYKAFPVQDDEYFLQLCRYVEANALKAKLVERAQDWKWSSLHQRMARRSAPQLTPWPPARPRGWTQLVNQALPSDLLVLIEQCLRRQRPLGSAEWTKRVARRLGLQQTLAPRGRPMKPMSHLSKRQQRRRRRATVDSGQKDK